MAFDALRIHRARKCQKHQNNQFLDRMYLLQIQRGAFEGLLENLRRSKTLRMKYLVTKDYRETALVQKYFIQLQIKYNKRVLARQNASKIQDFKANSLKFTLFKIWLSRFRRLRECEHILSKKVKSGSSQDIFKLWRCKYLLKKDFNFKYRLFNEKIRLRNMKIYFAEMKTAIRKIYIKR